MSIQEKTVQKALAIYYSGQGFAVKREVRTPVGNIDLILYQNMGIKGYQKIVVEVKEHKSIKHAIGQLLSYERYHADCTKLLVIYFCRDGSYRSIDAIHESFELKRQHPKLDIDFIGNLIPLEKLWSVDSQTNPQQCSKPSNESNLMMECKTLPPELSLSVVEQIVLTGLNYENITF